MITKIAKSLPIRFLVLCMPISVILLAKATEGYSTLSQGTNGTREIPSDPQSSIPSDLLTTPSSLTRDRSDHDVVDEDGHDDDRCHHQATEAWICRNHYVTDQSPPQVDVHTDGNPAVTGGITTEIRTLEEEEEVEDDDDSFTLGNTLVGLTFEAAVFLMLSSVQPPRGNSTSLLATWSPSWSRSPPPPPPSLPISLSASFPLTMALLAIVIGLTVGLMGRMMLRRGHAAVAKVCKYACILSFAAAFYSMTYGLVADNFAWAIWAAAGFLFLVFAYCIAQR